MTYAKSTDTKRLYIYLLYKRNRFVAELSVMQISHKNKRFATERGLTLLIRLNDN